MLLPLGIQYTLSYIVESRGDWFNYDWQVYHNTYVCTLLYHMHRNQPNTNFLCESLHVHKICEI